MEEKTKRMRGKSAETLLMEALEDLNRYEHAEKVDEVKIQSARTQVIATEKKTDRIEKLREDLKTARTRSPR